MALRIIPLDLAEANELVARWHRHHRPVIGHKFSLGCADDDRVCGAAIVGLPVARMLMDGNTLEVRRVVTDGTKNACSKLLSGCRRAALALGYGRLITYTLVEEGGASLKASNWKMVGLRADRHWNTPSRPRVEVKTGQKILWEAA